MPRPHRRALADEVYHVINRGNRRMKIFQKPEDYQAFLTVLSEALQRHRVDLFSWCLMPNHWHLVVRPRDDHQLAAFMGWLTLTHVRRHHGHHGNASGHLYQGRYKSFCVEKDEYFLTLCRYVEANALRAGLVRRAQDWTWSSLNQRLKRGSPDLPLSDWPVDRPANWLRRVNEPLTETQLQRLRQSVNRSRPLGSEPWTKRMARRLGLEQTLRARGRPRRALETLSPRQQRRRKAGRTERGMTPL